MILTAADLERVYIRTEEGPRSLASASNAQFDAWAKQRCHNIIGAGAWTPIERLLFCHWLETGIGPLLQVGPQMLDCVYRGVR